MTKIMNAETDPHLVQPDIDAISSDVLSKYITVDSYEIIQGNKVPDQIIVEDSQPSDVEAQTLEDISNQIASEQAEQDQTEQAAQEQVEQEEPAEETVEEQPAA